MWKMSGSNYKPYTERRDCYGLEVLGVTEMTEMDCAEGEHIVEPTEDWRTFKTRKIRNKKRRCRKPGALGIVYILW